MKALVLLIFVLLGIGRNLPYQGLYFYGLGAADALVLILVFLLLIDRFSRQRLLVEAAALRTPIVAMALLSTFAMASLAFNALRFGVQPKDIFEIFKYFYLLVIAVVACHCSRRYGVGPALGFAWGVIVSGVVALLSPMNPDVLGTPQIFNPNVIGNVLAVSVVLSSFIILRGHPLIGVLTAVIAAVISFFTFSKGTWLMSLLGLLACYLALRNVAHANAGMAMRLAKYLGYMAIATLVYAAIEFWETVSLIVEAKIAATDFEASAAEGGSFSARWGLMLSALHMFLMNPLLGVGISNFELVNGLLQEELGDAYYDDDNPNSAWFYVLACIGLPAFVCFVAVFVWFMHGVNQVPMPRRWERLPFVGCVGLVFLIGGSVQVEMLTAYYYWVALGIVATWRLGAAEPRGRWALRPNAASSLAAA